MDSDRIEGEAKEVEGEITGDESREAEGKAQSAWGETKDTADDAWDGAKDKADDAWEGVKDKVGDVLDGDDDDNKPEAERL
ncbi:MAG: CsbD family protein [Actinomycetota bacterium]|nr:CsbD family protein [Actinomycetota bacterium]